jgi:hypothetical protein
MECRCLHVLFLSWFLQKKANTKKFSFSLNPATARILSPRYRPATARILPKIRMSLLKKAVKLCFAKNYSYRVFT